MNKIKLLCTLFALCTTAHTSAIENKKENNQIEVGKKWEEEGEKKWKEVMSRIIDLEEKNNTTIRNFYNKCEEFQLFKDFDSQSDQNLNPKRIDTFMSIFRKMFPDATDLDALGKKSLKKKKEDPVAFYKTIFHPDTIESHFFQLKDAAPIGLWEIVRRTNEIQNEYKHIIKGKEKTINVIKTPQEMSFGGPNNPMHDIAEQIKVYEHGADLFQSNTVTELWRIKAGENATTKVLDFITKKHPYKYGHESITAITVKDHDHLNSVLGSLVANESEIENEIRNKTKHTELEKLISLANKIRELDEIAQEFAKRKQVRDAV
jgi:hypothetical protein